MQFSNRIQLLCAERKQKIVVLKILADDPKPGRILKQVQSLVERGIFVLHSKVDQTSVSIFSNACGL